MIGTLLIVGVVASSVGLLAYVLQQVRIKAPWMLETSGPYAVHVAEDEIVVEDPAGEHTLVEWSSLQAIVIRTTDQGPFVADVFWDLVAEGETVATFPNDADGIGRFLTAAPDHLQGFDHEAVIRAMGSTENDSFTVWRAG